MDSSNPYPNRLLRLKDILAPKGPIPVSRSTWWQGVKTGRFPKGRKLSHNITVWKSEDIDRLIAEDGCEFPSQGLYVTTEAAKPSADSSNRESAIEEKAARLKEDRSAKPK